MQDIEKNDASSSDDVGRLLTMDSVTESGSTPSVEASLIGNGEYAKTVIETADERGIRIREHPALANLLLRIDKDEVVPEDIRQVMDTMLEWVMKISDS